MSATPTKPTTTSLRGISFIKSFETLRLRAYRDLAGVPTIGWGHTANVKMGDTITEAQAAEFIRADLRRFETAVGRLAKVSLNQDEFDALVSFTFNLGEGALANSTLLRYLNSNKRVLAGSEFSKWLYASEQPSRGLLRRRLREAMLFIGG